MTIKPLGNRLVVRLVKQKNVSASGIILSGEEKNEQAKGQIIAIGGGQGSEENIQNLNLQVGQIVLFGRYGGEEIQDDEDNETTYKILKGSDVLAVIEN
jgi:chaperonin GroES